MQSPGHALLSAALGGAILMAVPPPVHPAVVIAVVLAVGVGIDLDHFLIALVSAGSLAPVRRVLARPRIALIEQDAIFREEEVTAPERLLTHAILGTCGVAAAWLIAPYWALVVGLTVAVHVLADVYADLRTGEYGI